MNTFLVLTFLVNFSVCRDFYVGMFKKNDFLVAQDRLYKERRPFGYTVTKYGRMFTCPITFFRVVDRLGVGTGPRVQITRGGLGKKYVVLQITSPYNLPLSANIYVGCSSEKTTTTRRPMSSSEEEQVGEDNVSPEKPRAVETTTKAKTMKKDEANKQASTNTTTAGKAEETTVASEAKAKEGETKKDEATTKAD